MTEDSGTFKTQQADLSPIRRFVMRVHTVAPLHHGGGNQLKPRIAGVFGPFFNETALNRCGMFESA
jgi:hypothetical protein